MYNVNTFLIIHHSGQRHKRINTFDHVRMVIGNVGDASLQFLASGLLWWDFERARRHICLEHIMYSVAVIRSNRLHEINCPNSTTNSKKILLQLIMSSIFLLAIGINGQLYYKVHHVVVSTWSDTMLRTVYNDRVYSHGILFLVRKVKYCEWIALAPAQHFSAAKSQITL